MQKLQVGCFRLLETPITTSRVYPACANTNRHAPRKRNAVSRQAHAINSNRSPRPARLCPQQWADHSGVGVATIKPVEITDGLASSRTTPPIDIGAFEVKNKLGQLLDWWSEARK